MDRFDIAIVGAGPAGMAAALALSRQGLECVLIERSRFPRDKICGDALSGKVVDTLNRIDPRLVRELQSMPKALPSWGITFFSTGGTALRLPFLPEGEKPAQAPGFICKRYDFDYFLYREVTGSPLVERREGFLAGHYEKTPDGWIVSDTGSGRSLVARLLIIADGAQSVFARKMAGIRMIRKHHCAGVRAYYRGVSGLDSEGFIELHFLRELLPGYLWIFPLPDGLANVGLGLRSDVASRRPVALRQWLPELIRKYPRLAGRFEQAELIDPPAGYGLPLGSRKLPVSGEGYLLTGDAASLIDPFTGEGIGNAMVSGALAAEIAQKAISQGDYSAHFLKQYDEQLYQRLWRELRLSRIMQQLIRKPWLLDFLIRQAARSETLRQAFIGMFENLDQRNQLKNPLFYLRVLARK